MGVSGFPAVQGAATWVNGGALPPADGSPTAAASYVAHGETMFQIAARWGSVNVPDAMLKLESDQTRLSGLGTVQYFEDFNEEDNVTGFTGDVFAAMASADYDGDQGRLGTTIGVKNADPNAQLVMGGLSGKYGAADTWVHSITKFLDAARVLVDGAPRRELPGRRRQRALLQLWTGRPGAGAEPRGRRRRGASSPRSSPTAIAIFRANRSGGRSSDTTRTRTRRSTRRRSARIRPSSCKGSGSSATLLAALAAGIERATVFELDDTCTPPSTACNTQFATCGLLATPGSMRKPAWYFLAAFRARLQTMIYVGEVASGQSDVRDRAVQGHGEHGRRASSCGRPRARPRCTPATRWRSRAARRRRRRPSRSQTNRPRVSRPR